jgi:hypothetical protein
MTRAQAHRGGVVLRGTRDRPWRKSIKDHSPGNAVRHFGVEVARVLICMRCPRCGLRLQVSRLQRLGNRLERSTSGPDVRAETFGGGGTVSRTTETGVLRGFRDHGSGRWVPGPSSWPVVCDRGPWTCSHCGWGADAARSHACIHNIECGGSVLLRPGVGFRIFRINSAGGCHLVTRLSAVRLSVNATAKQRAATRGDYSWELRCRKGLGGGESREGVGFYVWSGNGRVRGHEGARCATNGDHGRRDVGCVSGRITGRCCAGPSGGCVRCWVEVVGERRGREGPRWHECWNE